MELTWTETYQLQAQISSIMPKPENETLLAFVDECGVGDLISVTNKSF